MAGTIARSRTTIAVSEAFERQTIRFTGAHELGHWMLHPGQVMHRDRPVMGAGAMRGCPPREREADYFAACFLVPERLLVEAFQPRFRSSPPLTLEDDVAFLLCGDEGHSLLRAPTGSLEFPIAVARATSFEGRQFKSLATLFNVSLPTMAIRLRETGLVRG